MGVLGAALATLASRIFSAGLMLRYQQRPGQIITLGSLRKLRPDFSMIRRIFRLAIPNGVENSLFQGGRLLIAGLVATFPTAVRAAHGVVNSVSGFGYLPCTAIGLAAVSVISCILFEYAYCRLTRQRVTIGDLSACVTGLLLVMCLPATSSYWTPVLGGAFAIIVVKQFYGGLGRNFMNPALAGRMLLASFLGYVVSQRFDVWLYHFWWDLTAQKTGSRQGFLWLRNNGSTLISQLLNTLIFTLCAFAGWYDNDTLISILLSSYAIYIELGVNAPIEEPLYSLDPC